MNERERLAKKLGDGDGLNGGDRAILLALLQPSEPVADDEWGEEPGIPVGMASKIQAQMREPEREPSEPVDIVFDGPPGPESGRFVEVESPPGKSIKFGEWLQRDDGYWVLRINALNPPSREREAWTLEQNQNAAALSSLWKEGDDNGTD